MQQAPLPGGQVPRRPPRPGQSLNNLGFLLQDRGEYGKAEPYYRDALEMYRRLYPAEKYPDGHPDLAASLNNLGTCWMRKASTARRSRYYRDALEMYQRLYPPDKYPDGHPDLATSLNNLGDLLEPGRVRQGGAVLPRRPGHAQAPLPARKYPDGHPDLAMSLNNLGVLLRDRASTARRSRTTATPWTCTSSSTRPRSTPTATPTWPRASTTWASCWMDQGEYGKAEPYYRDALDMRKSSTRPRSTPTATPTWPRASTTWATCCRRGASTARRQMPWRKGRRCTTA